MLFNSLQFICVFLPIVWGIFALACWNEKRLVAIAWLLASSLFFYAYWNPVYLYLLAGSITGNFVIGAMLSRFRSKFILGTGIALNLLALGYFKYANFFLDIVGGFAGSGGSQLDIVLPLAISFFTFQQIAYLVDVYQCKTLERNFIYYGSFVSFFPQLIAGPIVHHQVLSPQLAKLGTRLVSSNFIAAGIALFSIGLFKKTVIADTLAVSSDQLHSAASNGIAFSFIDSIIGVLAFSFQIYFDFSGYSDMAIGLGLLFGVVLPINFYSPYKSRGFAEFWRRWHITLSNFLRDYIYIPLGGNRNGVVVQYAAILTTMLLGGLWHGAGWTFVIWGGLQGCAIAFSHFVSNSTDLASSDRANNGRGGVVWALVKPLQIVSLFLAVTLLWVLFRAESWQGAMSIYGVLFGGDSGGSLNLIADKAVILMLGFAAFVVWCLPNSMDYIGVGRFIADLRSEHRGIDGAVQFNNSQSSPSVLTLVARWRPGALHLVVSVCAFVCSLLFMQTTLVQEFIYFDF